MPANVSNGSIVQGNERAQVIHYLAEGFSVRYVANRFKRSEHTIAAIRDIESRTIAERKPVLAAQAERNAILAADVVQDDLRADKLHGVQAATVFGIMVDKSLALRGDAALTVRHEHLHAHLSDSDVWDYMLKRSQQPRALPAPNAPQDSNPTHSHDQSATTSPSAQKGRNGARKKSARRAVNV